MSHDTSGMTRRDFMQAAAAGVAGSAFASSLAGAAPLTGRPAARVPGASERIRFAVVGGSRTPLSLGSSLSAAGDVEIVAVSDACPGAQGEFRPRRAA